MVQLTESEERIKKAKLKLYGALRQKPVEKLTDTEIEIQYQLSMDSDVQEFFDKLRKQMNEMPRHHLEIPEPPHGFDPSGPSFPCNIEIKPDFTPDFDFPNIGAMVRKAKKED